MSKSIEGGRSATLEATKGKAKSYRERIRAARLQSSISRIKSNLYTLPEAKTELNDGPVNYVAEVKAPHPAYGETLTATMVVEGRWGRNDVRVHAGWDYDTGCMIDLSLVETKSIGSEIIEEASLRLEGGAIDPDSTMTLSDACLHMRALDRVIRCEAASSYYRNSLFDVRFD